MDRERVPNPKKRANRGRQRKKASPGLRVKDRRGYWYVIGTVRAGGHSIRVRRSSGLPAQPELYEAADATRLKIETEIRNEAIHGIKPSMPAVIAAARYLKRTKKNGRKPGWREKDMCKHVALRFGTRHLKEISDAEWHEMVETRCRRSGSSSRERFLNALLSFLNWCSRKPRQWLAEPPAFDRDAEARNPSKRKKRRVGDFTPDLVMLFIEHAGWHLKPQLAVEWSTGARVSSILHGARLCDLILAPGRDAITFHDTKNNKTVHAALHPWAAGILKTYLGERGKLHDREGPLFLNHVCKPYKRGEVLTGAQNRKAFNNTKARAIAAMRQEAVREVLVLRGVGQRAAAQERLNWHLDRVQLMSQITQHWFRHLLATTLQAEGWDRGTMKGQGGWTDDRSLDGYLHDIPDHRRKAINSLPIGPGEPGLVKNKG